MMNSSLRSSLYFLLKSAFGFWGKYYGWFVSWRIAIIPFGFVVEVLFFIIFPFSLGRKENTFARILIAPADLHRINYSN